MQAIAINGSPRKRHNTATLLEKALEGAASAGAETRLVHLYDISYKGCVSCLACKRLGNASPVCAFRDGLTPLLQSVQQTDVVFFGSPVYFGVESGMMRSFLERLLFPCLQYRPGLGTLFTRPIKTAFIYTMNVARQPVMKNVGVKVNPVQTPYVTPESMVARLLGHCEPLYCYDTQQVDDYSRYDMTLFDAEAKYRHHADQFPKDCQAAFALGAKLAG